MVRESLVSVLILAVFLSASGILLLLPQEAEAVSSRVIRLRGVVHIYGGTWLGPGFSAPEEEPADPEPPATADMIAWYRGDSLQGSGTATSWDDKTANNRDATAFNTISIITSAVGTRSAARFARNGDNSDYFRWNGDAAQGAPYTIVAVANPDAAALTFSPFLGSTGMSFGLGVWGSGTSVAGMYASNFGYVDGTTNLLNTWRTIQADFNGDSSEIYVNNVSEESVTSPAGTINISDIIIGSADPEFGDEQGVAVYSFSGDIAEIIIYDRLLTGGERTELDEYVADYYGL